MCVDLQNSQSIQITPDIKIEKNVMRCSECNKKINIINSIECQCKKLLCYKHRYQTEHVCNFDFKTKERNILAKSLVKIENDKIIKI